MAYTLRSVESPQENVKCHYHRVPNKLRNSAKLPPESKYHVGKAKAKQKVSSQPSGDGSFTMSGVTTNQYVEQRTINRKSGEARRRRNHALPSFVLWQTQEASIQAQELGSHTYNAASKSTWTSEAQGQWFSWNRCINEDIPESMCCQYENKKSHDQSIQIVSNFILKSISKSKSVDKIAVISKSYGCLEWVLHGNWSFPFVRILTTYIYAVDSHFVFKIKSSIFWDTYTKTYLVSGVTDISANTAILAVECLILEQSTTLLLLAKLNKFLDTLIQKRVF